MELDILLHRILIDNRIEDIMSALDYDLDAQTQQLLENKLLTHPQRTNPLTARFK